MTENKENIIEDGAGGGKYEGIILIRPTIMADAEILFKWRNDPNTYAYFLTPKPVVWEEHIKWLESSLQNSDRELFIVTNEKDEPIGNARVDREADDGVEIFELSWAVAPKWRGKGIGKKMIGALLAAPILKNKKLKAVIKKDNIASIKMAESFGFKNCGWKGDFGEWFLDNN